MTSRGDNKNVGKTWAFCLVSNILTNLHLLIKSSTSSILVTMFTKLTNIDQVHLLHFLHESETDIQIFSLVNVHPRIHLHPLKWKERWYEKEREKRGEGWNCINGEALPIHVQTHKVPNTTKYMYMQGRGYDTCKGGPTVYMHISMY